MNRVGRTRRDPYLKQWKVIVFHPEYFGLHELVDQVSFERYGSRLWNVFDERILRAADRLRRRYGPLVCCDWHCGGTNHFRGWRAPGCNVGALLSQHRFGRALDLIPQRCTAEEIRQDLLDAPDFVLGDLGQWLVTAFEADVSWLHIDCRNRDVFAEGFLVFGA